MKQLFLFTTAAEDTRRLREEYDILAADYRDLEAQHAHLQARLENAKEEFRKLRAERDDLHRKLTALQAETTGHLRDLDTARRELAEVRATAREWFMLATQSPRPQAALEPTLKRLLLVAHPDKWSQGQPAQELAHELAIHINSLREEVPR